MIVEKIEFKDEILDVTSQPDSKPRYVIKDNNGNIIYNNVTLELATPVIQEGTPINSSMLNKVNHVMLSLASASNGEDFRKYIENGEYGGIKTPDVLDPLYEFKDLWQKEIENKIYNLQIGASNLQSSISSLQTRVTNLETRVTNLEAQ